MIKPGRTHEKAAHLRQRVLLFDASCGVSLYDNRGGPITVNLKNPFIHNPSTKPVCVSRSQPAAKPPP